MKIKIWNNGEWKMIDDGMGFFVGRCGSGQSVFGENARLFKVNKNSLVFKTERGSLIKTKRDSLNTIGKAKKEGYFVSIGSREDGYIKERISYWNEKKCAFEYK